MALALVLLSDWRYILYVPPLEWSDKRTSNLKKNAVRLRNRSLIQSVQ